MQKKLSFIHPTKISEMKFKANLPDDIIKIL